MRVEQFRLTNNGRGYRLAKSPDVDNLLSPDSYRRIAFQKSKRGVRTETETWLDKDSVYAYSQINYGIDDYGREYYTNHTILIRYKDLAMQAVASVKLESVFSQAYDERSKVLPTLQI